jgi:hypothetical protein
MFLTFISSSSELIKQHFSAVWTQIVRHFGCFLFGSLDVIHSAFWQNGMSAVLKPDKDIEILRILLQKEYNNV